MIKDCIWKGRRLSCSAIFTMQPTDQGMCCSFNKEKADEMLRTSRYQRQLIRLTEQDKKNSVGSREPDWQAQIILQYYTLMQIKLSVALLLLTRYDETPESGQHKGLSIMLDAHKDQLSTSSVLNNFMVQQITFIVYNFDTVFSY